MDDHQHQGAQLVSDAAQRRGESGHILTLQLRMLLLGRHCLLLCTHCNVL